MRAATAAGGRVVMGLLTELTVAGAAGAAEQSGYVDLLAAGAVVARSAPLPRLHAAGALSISVYTSLPAVELIKPAMNGAPFSG